MERIDNEYYVSLEVAKLLKQAGFNWECRKIYYKYIEDAGNWSLENNYMNHHRILEVDYSLLAPTLDIAQRWLREVKSFMVETTFITDDYRVIYQANLYEVISENSTGRVCELISVVKGQSELKRTYEEAQEAGIKKVLELILEKGK